MTVTICVSRMVVVRDKREVYVRGTSRSLARYLTYDPPVRQEDPRCAHSLAESRCHGTHPLGRALLVHRRWNTYALQDFSYLRGGIMCLLYIAFFNSEHKVYFAGESAYTFPLPVYYVKMLK